MRRAATAPQRDLWQQQQRRAGEEDGDGRVRQMAQGSGSPRARLLLLLLCAPSRLARVPSVPSSTRGARIPGCSGLKSLA